MIFGRTKSATPVATVPDATRAPASIDPSAVLDALGDVLAAYGRGGFDLPNRPAADIAAELERWRLHAVLGAPIDEGGVPTGFDRDFRGVARTFAEHRRTEKRLTEAALSDLRDCLWSCVQRVHVAVQADVEADTATSAQVARLQSAIQHLETGAVKDEVLQAITAMEQISRVRREKQQSSFAQLAERIDELAVQLEDARRASETDTLTGLGNRKRFEASAERLLQMHSISRAPTTMMMIDLDGLKSINDTLGHPAGDIALTTFASTLAKVFLRECDVQCRVGGDEFVVLLPGTAQAMAERLADRLKATLASLAPFGEDGPRVAASIGFAEARVGDSVLLWTSRADEALYRAKAESRQRVAALV